jgi:hypothetical protein
MSFRGFSVLPPQGSGWYLTQHTPSKVLFQRALTDLGSGSVGSHTFGVLAGVVYLEEGPVADLQAFAEQRLRGGERFTTLRSRVVPEQSLGAECVRVASLSEERDNPMSPSAVLALSIEGVYCRHPLSPRFLFLFSYSERHPKTEASRLDVTLRSEVEAVLRSVVFSAFPRAELPADARVTPPDPGVPGDRASFSGRWSGTLDSGLDHILVVEQVRADEALVIVSLGLLRGPSWQRQRALFRHGALVIQTPAGTSAAYRLQADGTLRAVVTNGEETMQATMTRGGE